MQHFTLIFISFSFLLQLRFMIKDSLIQVHIWFSAQYFAVQWLENDFRHSKMWFLLWNIDNLFNLIRAFMELMFGSAAREALWNLTTGVIPLPTRSYFRSPLASIFGHSDNCWRVWRAHQGSEPREEQETSMWTQTSRSAGSIYSSSVIRRITGLLQLPYVSSGCHFLSNPFSP